MRYAFTSLSISLVNRVMDVLLTASSLDGSIVDQHTRENYDRSKGFFVEYGIKNIPLVAAMWHQADLNTDWNGETDAVHGEYEILKFAWESTLNFGMRQTEQESMAEDCYQQAEKVACDFENNLWLAMVVINALEALEGGVRNFWSTEGLILEIRNEFKHDREAVESQIKAILAGNAHFDFLTKRDA